MPESPLFGSAQSASIRIVVSPDGSSPRMSSSVSAEHALNVNCISDTPRRLPMPATDVSAEHA